MLKLTKEILPLFLKFNFKKLVINETKKGFSYSCELFYNSKKIANVKNTNKELSIKYLKSGGDILEKSKISDFYDGKNDIISELVETAIQYDVMLKTQPNTIFYINNKDVIKQVNYHQSILKLIGLGHIRRIRSKVDEIHHNGGIILNTNLEALGI